MKKSFLEALKQNGELSVNEPMKNHTSLRIGGPAEYFIKPKDVSALKRCVMLAKEYNIPLTIVGKGTNLLVKDRGICGIVIKLDRGFDYIKVDGNTIKAGASSLLAAVSLKAMKYELGGLEWAVGIPGSVGGAIIMNAGAYGFSIGEVTERVKVLSYTGEILEFSKEQMNFTYRSSILREKKIGIVLEAIFNLAHADEMFIKEQMKKYIVKRRLTQPGGYPSAGSIFENPPGNSAGKLIELAGCKGLRAGNALVSEKHANWIVNLGGATAKDVVTLINIIKDKVKSKFDIDLQLEVRVLG